MALFNRFFLNFNKFKINYQKVQNFSHAKTISNVDSIDNVVLTNKINKVFKITLNRPNKFNAMSFQMYEEFINALRVANSDTETSVTVITGNGKYFSSGNDMSIFMLRNKPELLTKFINTFCEFVNLFIEHKKPLITLVNGPAIGIGVTLLGLSDLNISSDKATFHVPFTSLGLSPEGCSSYTFPKLMGTSKATEVLLFGKKLTAQEAMDRNLIAQTIPDDCFNEKAVKKVLQLSELPPISLCSSKQLIRSTNKSKLIATNLKEIDLFIERWSSNECANVIDKITKQKF